MLVFDQLRKGDRPLQVLAVFVLSGLGVLFLGLWYVQVLSSRRFQASQVSQTFRTVRIPAMRGNILDAQGRPLAGNRPSYNVNLYLDELRPLFQRQYSNSVKAVQMARAAAGESSRLSRSNRIELGKIVRHYVASNLVLQVSSALQRPLQLNYRGFQEHYEQRLFLPMPVLADLSPQQVGQFLEQPGNYPGIDLEVQPLRIYPHRLAAHLLGHLQRDDAPADEEAFFNYRMPDFRGAIGVEAAFDQHLRGRTGVKSVMVNSLGFRQSDNVWSPAEAGKNIILTIDLAIQQAAEKALGNSIHGLNTRGAVVVMDTRNGDLIALASSPTFDPNSFLPRMSSEEWQRINDPQLRPLINRATYGIYAPGSIFKVVVGLAGLEAGTLNPNEIYHSEGEYRLGRDRVIRDLAGKGDFDFKRALMRSSNPYFIHEGLKVGVDRILELGKRLHLGERTGIPTRQELAGIFPTREWQAENLGGVWLDGHTANLCIGQGEIAITPLQVAVMIAAVANRGTVYWPRLVARVEPPHSAMDAAPVHYPAGRIRDRLALKKRTFDVVHEAMLADVEDADGTGHRAFVPGMRICAKTGTAQRKLGARTVGWNTWFASFAPYESPRHAVVVMIETDHGGSGGETCAPVAQQVYLALQKRDRSPDGRSETMAKAH